MKRLMSSVLTAMSIRRKDKFYFWYIYHNM